MCISHEPHQLLNHEGIFHHIKTEMEVKKEIISSEEDSSLLAILELVNMFWEKQISAPP